MGKELAGLVPPAHSYIRDGIISEGNVLGVKRGKSSWASGLGLKPGGEYTFFAGCGYQLMQLAEGMSGAAGTTRRVGLGMETSMGLARALGRVGVDVPTLVGRAGSLGKADPYTPALASAVRVLRKLGVDIGYLGKEEPCCGSPMYYSGYVEEYAENAQESYAALKSRGVKKVIGMLPSCTASFRYLYPRYVQEWDLEVSQFLEVVAEKLREGKASAGLQERLVATYHDPCQLSRYLNVVREPREIMAGIERLELREVADSEKGEWSGCCGGGGGMEMSSPELSERVGARRMEQLLATGASVIVTHCPACMMQLRKAARNLKARVEVMDLAVLLDMALEKA